MSFLNTQNLVNFANKECITFSISNNSDLNLHYSKGKPPPEFIQATREHKQELVRYILNVGNISGNSSNNQDVQSPKALIDKHFGQTRELTAEEHSLLNESDIKSHYLIRGLSTAALEELKSDLETLSDGQVAEMAKTLNVEKGKPVAELKIWGISSQELKEFLGEEWQDYKDNPEELEAWAKLLYERRLMEQGIVPDRYIASVYCEECRDYVPVPPSMVTANKVVHCT